MYKQQRQTRSRLRARVVASVVGLEFGVGSDLTQSGGNRGDQNAIRARQIALYLFHMLFGTSMSEAARQFGRHPSTAKHSCKIVEELRGDPVFDQRIDKLEAFLAQVYILQGDHA